MKDPFKGAFKILLAKNNQKKLRMVESCNWHTQCSWSTSVGRFTPSSISHYDRPDDRGHRVYLLRVNFTPCCCCAAPTSILRGHQQPGSNQPPLEDFTWITFNQNKMQCDSLETPNKHNL